MPGESTETSVCEPVTPTTSPASLRQVRPWSSLCTTPVSWLGSPPGWPSTAGFPSRQVNAAYSRPVRAYVSPCRYRLRVVLVAPPARYAPVAEDHRPSRYQPPSPYSASSTAPLPDPPVRKLNCSRPEGVTRNLG